MSDNQAVPHYLTAWREKACEGDGWLGSAATSYGVMWLIFVSEVVWFVDLFL